MNNVDTFFLVDESVDLETIKIKVNEYKNSKIVSFDFNTHKLLSENGIAHNKIEDYLDNSDYQKIDDSVVSLSVNWYKKKNLEPYLEYRNINLGSLLEIEMPSFFFPIMKKFYGVLRLYEKDKPSMIVASITISNIVKTISNEVHVNTFEKIKKVLDRSVLSMIQYPYSDTPGGSFLSNGGLVPLVFGSLKTLGSGPV